jgi:hypothetical protein
LLQIGKLDSFLVGAALRRIEPGSTDDAVSPTVAVFALAAWAVIPLALGAWRTARRDA